MAGYDEMGMFRNVNRENAFYEILDQIFENIQDGSLKQGDALPAERSMAEAMGISRPVLREALRALELLGIITAVHGGGNYISKDLEYCLIGPLSILFRLNNSSVQQAQELRSALECKAAALAAEKCTPLDAAELQLFIAKLDAETDEKVRADLDRDLHMKIGKMAGNPMILSVLSASAQLTENIISGIRAYIMQKNKTSSEVDEQHRKLVGAIADHQAEQAERYMKEHMDTIEQYIGEIALAQIPDRK